jgi:hypothetical protein
LVSVASVQAAPARRAFHFLLRGLPTFPRFDFLTWRSLAISEAVQSLTARPFWICGLGAFNPPAIHCWSLCRLIPAAFAASPVV